MAARKKKIEHIGIIGYRWFDRVNGNTYNSAEIFVNGRKVGFVPFGYGYGTHYEDRAVEWLEKNGYITREHYAHGGGEPLWQIAKRIGFDKDVSHIDVPRKKDLARTP